ncbi:MAG: type 4a pilus biogenesis protein PilO [Candidatus Omnitrophica bacterium]|nr:type 4a pilus biogenesis protein PilO [Candidatus Omnitrophota bacterium]
MDLLNKLSPREKNILYVVIGVVIIALSYNFLIGPLINQWNSINRNIKLSKIKLQKSLSVIKKKPEIDKEYATYAARMKSKGSDEQDITQILNELETLSRKANLKITSMRPKPSKDKGYYKRFVVEIETESPMQSLMKFIYDVKNSPQLLKVDRLNLSTKSSQEGTLIRSSMVISKVVIK